MLLSNPLLSNPLASPLLPPLGWTMGGLLASTLVALLVGVRGRWSVLRGSTLFVRWRTWLLIAPLFTLVVLSGPLLLAVLAGALAIQGAREYAALTRLSGIDRVVLLVCCVLVPAGALWLPSQLVVPALVLLPLAVSLSPLLNQDAEHGLARLSRLAFGVGYLPVSLGLLVVVDRAPNGGPGLLLVLALAVALSDVGAFTLGRWVGRRALAPRLSASKTWAGLLGNVVGALVGLLLLEPLLPAAVRAPVLGVPVLGAPALALLVGLGAAWGDLLESMLKRSAAVKDSGDWLPGFGGLLDRLDSLLVVLPLAYLLLEVLA